MNPQDALKIVASDEVRINGPRLLANALREIDDKIAGALRLFTDHKIEYERDGKESYKFCRQCAEHSYDTFMRHYCVKRYSTSVADAFELVYYIAERGWVISLSVDLKPDRPRVVITAKPRNQNLVEITKCETSLPAAICSMMLQWIKLNV